MLKPERRIPKEEAERIIQEIRDMSGRDIEENVIYEYKHYLIWRHGYLIFISDKDIKERRQNETINSLDEGR